MQPVRKKVCLVNQRRKHLKLKKYVKKLKHEKNELMKNNTISSLARAAQDGQEFEYYNVVLTNLSNYEFKLISFQ